MSAHSSSMSHAPMSRARGQALIAALLLVTVLAAGALLANGDLRARAEAVAHARSLEALAQAAAVLSFETMGTRPDADSIVYFAGIDEARFRRPVVPGDQLLLEVELLRNVRGISKYSATARVGEEVAAQAQLMCALKGLK